MRHKKEVLVAAIIVLSLVIALIAFAILRSRSRHEEIAKQELKLSGELVNSVRVIKIKVRRFEFDPGTVVVKVGEKVRLEVTSQDVMHGIRIEDFGINRELKPGKTEAVTFTADKPGNHHFHCSVYCGNGHGDMHGELIVLSD